VRSHFRCASAVSSTSSPRSATSPRTRTSRRSPEGAVTNGVTHLFGGGHREVAAGIRPLKLPSPLANATAEPARVDARSNWLVVLVHFDVDGESMTTCSPRSTRTARPAPTCARSRSDSMRKRSRPLRERCIMLVRKSSNDELRDFGGWHLALEALGAATARAVRAGRARQRQRLLPGARPDAVPRRDAHDDADVFAATDSLSGGRYHLQSYFLALRPRALDAARPEIARGSPSRPSATKLSLIQRFEVGLTRVRPRGRDSPPRCSAPDRRHRPTCPHR
jgi:hypothetical protein